MLKMLKKAFNMLKMLEKAFKQLAKSKNVQEVEHIENDGKDVSNVEEGVEYPPPIRYHSCY